MTSDVPYWRPPTPQSVWSVSWGLMVSKPVWGQPPVGRQLARNSIQKWRTSLDGIAQFVDQRVKDHNHRRDRRSPFGHPFSEIDCGLSGCASMSIPRA